MSLPTHMAAELLYDRAGFGDLAAALVAAVAPGGWLWIADAERVDTRSFFEVLARMGLAPAIDEVREVREEGSRIQVRIRGYRVTR